MNDLQGDSPNKIGKIIASIVRYDKLDIAIISALMQKELEKNDILIKRINYIIELLRKSWQREEISLEQLDELVKPLLKIKRDLNEKNKKRI